MLMLNPNTMKRPVQLYGLSMNKKNTLHTFESQRINSMIDWFKQKKQIKHQFLVVHFLYPIVSPWNNPHWMVPNWEFQNFIIQKYYFEICSF